LIVVTGQDADRGRLWRPRSGGNPNGGCAPVASTLSIVATAHGEDFSGIGVILISYEKTIANGRQC
jgi:hypothetical protein